MLTGLRDEIKEEIKKILNYSDFNSRLTDETSLVVSGLLSSLQIVEIASWIEKKYGVDFSKVGFNTYDFDSIAAMEHLINRYSRLYTS